MMQLVFAILLFIGQIGDRGDRAFFMTYGSPHLLMAGSLEYRGSVSNLVTAALQTKGLVDQAKILSDFKEALELLGAMAWLFSIALAVGAIAVFGSYKNGLYLLIGPPLFFFMIKTTVSTNGTHLKIGEREIAISRQDQNSFLRYISAIQNSDGTEGSANISFFFGVYDSIVSEAVQGVVGVLMDTKNRDDLRFAMREQALSYVLQSTPEQPGLSQLISAIHFGDCAELTEEQLRVGYARKNASEGTSRADIQKSIALLENQWNLKGASNLDTQTKEYLISMKGVRSEFDDVTITSPEEQFVPAPSCAQLWKWIKGSCLAMAEERLKPESFQGIVSQSSEMPWEQIYEDVKTILAQGSGAPSGEQINTATTMLAAFIYKNAIGKATHSALQQQVFNRVPFNEQKFEGIFNHLADAESAGGFFKLKYFGGSIKYIQGLLLYLLSIGFPFFAVLLVIPGRAMSMLVWCTIWAWVKSWDVGFALVHVTRDMLWYLLGTRMNQHHETPSWDDPWSIVSVINHNDPLANQNTYWEITSLLTVAVPFLTAHFFMGANYAFNAFHSSIDGTSNTFGSLQPKGRKRELANTLENELRGRTYRGASMAQADQLHSEGIMTLDGREVASPVPQSVRALYWAERERNRLREINNPDAATKAEIGRLNKQIEQLKKEASLDYGAELPGVRGQIGLAKDGAENQWMSAMSYGPVSSEGVELLGNAEKWKRARLSYARVEEQLKASPADKSSLERRRDALGKEIMAYEEKFQQIAERGVVGEQQVKNAKAWAEATAGLAPLYSDPKRAEEVVRETRFYRDAQGFLAAITGRTSTSVEKAMTKNTEEMLKAQTEVAQMARGQRDGDNIYNTTSVRDWAGKPLGLPEDYSDKAGTK